ncbi:MAG: hypothetical protein HY235_28355 [Acidobacteria bacterium]|nr:hypothetical protein [Acidobacteriota bacterium]
MKIAPLVLAAVLMVLGFLSASLSFGKPEYTKTEKKACTACHTTAKPKDKNDLNDVGKCYGEKKSLKDCAKK